ncbi:MAG TPA: hypothetical protein VFW65_38010 [Pseudonocardiaceae bacterium]|nr:hypothetical protein [Pseudonocardiaceae bacterium]
MAETALPLCLGAVVAGPPGVGQYVLEAVGGRPMAALHMVRITKAARRHLFADAVASAAGDVQCLLVQGTARL